MSRTVTEQTSLPSMPPKLVTAVAVTLWIWMPKIVGGFMKASLAQLRADVVWAETARGQVRIVVRRRPSRPAAYVGARTRSFNSVWARKQHHNYQFGEIRAFRLVSLVLKKKKN